MADWTFDSDTVQPCFPRAPLYPRELLSVISRVFIVPVEPTMLDTELHRETYGFFPTLGLTTAELPLGEFFTGSATYPTSRFFRIF